MSTMCNTGCSEVLDHNLDTCIPEVQGVPDCLDMHFQSSALICTCMSEHTNLHLEDQYDPERQHKRGTDKPPVPMTGSLDPVGLQHLRY